MSCYFDFTYNYLNETIHDTIINEFLKLHQPHKLSMLRWLYQPLPLHRTEILAARLVCKGMKSAVDHNTKFIETHLVMGNTAIPPTVNLKWFAGKVHLKLTSQATTEAVVASYLHALSGAKVTVDYSGLNKRVKDEKVRWLVGYSNIVAVDLSFCRKITNAAMASLATCRGLEFAFLDYCERLTDAGVALLATCPELKFVEIGLCDEITDAAVALLATCPKLQTLDISLCDKITNAAMASLERHPTFQSGSFGCNSNTVSDQMVASLATCPNLKMLGITSCQNLTDTAIAHLAGCPNLAWLRISRCSQITDASIGMLARHKTLEEVILFDCLKVTDAAMTMSTEQTKLSRVTIHGLDKLTILRSTGRPVV